MGLNENYKNRHKPAKPGNSKFKQGYFHPRNPEKCLTANSNIYGSNYELQFNNLDPTDMRFWKTSMYYTDFWIELATDDGGIRKIFIEIKPYAQTIPPAPLESRGKRPSKTAYNREVKTYLQNSAKWKAAEQFCKERGCEFIIVTEKTLKKLGLQ